MKLNRPRQTLQFHCTFTFKSTDKYRLFSSCPLVLTHKGFIAQELASKERQNFGLEFDTAIGHGHIINTI